MNKIIVAGASLLVISFCTFAQDSRKLTPAQLEIEKQQQRLSSADQEERRDAVMRLGTMRLEAASRAAVPGLKDLSPIIRATATKAILSMGGEESANLLIPLLSDKDEFVRRETAYALGLTRSRSATAALSERLLNDKEDGVRGAAAVALGQIADEAAVVALVGTLAPELSAPANSKRKREQNVFVLRAAATALGQIGSRAGTAALISALSNEKFPDDVRREAARSLGLIGDPSAEPALRVAATSSDPYLSEIAHKAIHRLRR
ncbi:MAG TPA: HEAT repeat domain-containing protein [Pyrinomonadaceae bacterium]|nr:HEAT repeat domain-containing protein [Pyrinomonadaceae bacterium]